jgi:hypothetical protein
MKDKKIIKKIIIGLLVAIVLLFLYSLFVPAKDDTNQNTTLKSLLNSSVLGQVQETDVALANGEILRVLTNIENISLDDDIFSNPIFGLLQDSRFSIPNPARIGRENPFLPTGFDAIAQAQQSANSTPNTTVATGFFNETSSSEGTSAPSGAGL